MPAISVQNLGKRYRVNHAARSHGRYRTLRDTLADAATAPLRRFRNGGATGTTEDFWALKDVSFDIEPGEVVGIIGRNGAGKSTLLKVLSRITEPTTGEVRLNGRIASLLEVGTGFHPELTGRENIYLNGSILGMSRREIERQFDAIVDFAEVDRFLDTPVKRYSSGMYVRLAFSVAAHLDPEIMIVDEVLAVGDATYQRKCIERMASLARSGATVLFVSHNMELIPRLCQRAILLNQGRVQTDGMARDVTDRYLKWQAQASEGEDLTARFRTGDGRAKFTRLRLLNGDGEAVSSHTSGEDLILRMTIDSKVDIPDVALAVVLSNVYGTRIITSWTREVGFTADLSCGTQTFDCRFRNVLLRPGHQFQVGLWLATQNVIDSIEQAYIADVDYSEATRDLSSDSAQGIILCDYSWSRVNDINKDVKNGRVPLTSEVAVGSDVRCT